MMALPRPGVDRRTPPACPAPRPLGPADLSACLKLDASALGGLWSAAQWQTELAAESRPGLGIWQGGELVAMACGWMILEELHITLVAVDPVRRRQGLGARMLQALLELGRSHGARHATLEVSTVNAPALALYAAAGFQQAGVRRRYYRNGEDALIEWMRLVP
ncbi:MAG: ribosomal protein S18-alanine N-acetyltransferase [Cyanobium sp.]